MKQEYLDSLRSRGVSWDTEDTESIKAHRWYIGGGDGKKKYVLTSIGGRTVYLHRLIMDPPAGIEVDHIDGNSLNNRRSNLRMATRQQNCINRGPLKGNGRTSRFKGVCKQNPALERWIARIYVDGKRIHLGTFPSEIEAARAYNRAASKQWGEFAFLNDVSDERSAA